MIKSEIDDIYYKNNKKILEGIEGENGLIYCVNRYKEFDFLKSKLRDNFLIFYKSCFSLLNKKFMTSSTDRITYLTLEHYFSDFINYNLNNLVSTNRFRTDLLENLMDIFKESDVFSDFKLVNNCAIDGSRLSYIQ